MSKKREATKGTSITAAAVISNKLNETSAGEDDGQSHASVSSVQYKKSGRMKSVRAQGEKTNKKSKSLGKVSGAAIAEIEKSTVDRATFTKEGNGAKPSPNKKNKSVLSRLLESFPSKNSTCSLSQIRATFYPKFENEKSDQEVIRLVPCLLHSCFANDICVKLCTWKDWITPLMHFVSIFK